MRNNYKFFQNKECEHFPCHENTDGSLNCLFCFCPLYALGDKCGGDFTYNDKGIKDCSDCLIPHSEKGYDYVTSKCKELQKMAKKL